MKLRYLDEYLNWYVYLFKVKKDLEKYPAVKGVIRHLFFTDSRLTREELFCQTSNILRRNGEKLLSVHRSAALHVACRRLP